MSYYGACEFIGYTLEGLEVFEYRSACHGTWWTVGYKHVTAKPYIKTRGAKV